MIHSTLWRGKQEKKKKNFKSRSVKVPKGISTHTPIPTDLNRHLNVKTTLSLSASLTTGRFCTDPAVGEGSQLLVHRLEVLPG